MTMPLSLSHNTSLFKCTLAASHAAPWCNHGQYANARLLHYAFCKTRPA